MPSESYRSGSADQSERLLRPALLVPLVFVVAAQAGVLGFGAVAVFVAVIQGNAWSVPGGVFLALIFGAGAVWLGSAARGAWVGRRWSRAAVFTAQLFSLVAAGAVVHPYSPVGAIALVVAAGGAMACLFVPAVVDWTTQDVPQRLR